MSGKPVLHTERLNLRRPRSGDLDAFAEIFGDAEVMRYVGYGVPLAHDEVASMLERIEQRFDADGFGQFAVERVEDGQVIGRVGLLPLDPETWQGGSRAAIGERAEIEIGWTLARASWGAGYALEAAIAVRDWARVEIGLHRLVSIVQFGNERSVRLAHRLGARCEREIITPSPDALGCSATFLVLPPVARPNRLPSAEAQCSRSSSPRRSGIAAGTAGGSLGRRPNLA